MEDLNDIFKEPEEGQGIVIGNSRWCVRDGRASCVYIPDDKPKDHKNYFENMSREDLIEALECGANNITLLQDERDVAENNWNKLKEKIETAIRASEDDGLIRVGQFRTLNSIDNFIKELEGKNG